MRGSEALPKWVWLSISVWIQLISSFWTRLSYDMKNYHADRGECYRPRRREQREYRQFRQRDNLQITVIIRWVAFLLFLLCWGSNLPADFFFAKRVKCSFNFRLFYQTKQPLPQGFSVGLLFFSVGYFAPLMSFYPILQTSKFWQR